MVLRLAIFGLIGLKQEIASRTQELYLNSGFAFYAGNSTCSQLLSAISYVWLFSDREIFGLINIGLKQNT